jgi:hypothetical protein
MAPVWSSLSEMDTGQGADNGLGLLVQVAIALGGLPPGYGQVVQYS